MTAASEIMKSEKLDDFDYKVALQQQMVAAAAAAEANRTTAVLRPLQIGAPALSSPESTEPAAPPSNEQPPIGPTRPDPSTSSNSEAPRRLHVSNIPFKYRDPDLVAMFEKMGPVAEVEIIFNERGSKGFGFVTMQRPEDAERARAELNGVTIEGRRVEVNLATQRIHNKKPAKPLISVAIDPMATQNAFAAQQLQRAALLQQQQQQQHQLLAQQMLLPRQQFLIPPTSAAAALNMHALQLQLLAGQQLQGQHLLLNALPPAAPPTSMAQQLYQQQQQQAALGLDPMAQQMAALMAIEQQRIQMAAVAQGRLATGAARIPTSTAAGAAAAVGGAIPPPPPAGPPTATIGEQYLQQSLPGGLHALHPAAAALQRRFAPY